MNVQDINKKIKKLKLLVSLSNSLNKLTYNQFTENLNTSIAQIKKEVKNFLNEKQNAQKWDKESDDKTKSNFDKLNKDTKIIEKPHSNSKTEILKKIENIKPSEEKNQYDDIIVSKFLSQIKNNDFYQYVFDKIKENSKDPRKTIALINDKLNDKHYYLKNGFIYLTADNLNISFNSDLLLNVQQKRNNFLFNAQNRFKYGDSDKSLNNPKIKPSKDD